MKAYKLIKKGKDGKVISVSPKYDAKTLCYAIDTEINLSIHDFSVIEVNDVTAEFIEVDGYWKHEPVGEE